ncbi:hypothetical protein LEM8419_00035 [Neolewinella maritima]|uniref:DUF2141 domain-containing protein n=1 Tax=Neolewinella maritima TaxID=1383882 RepID=A0ABN8F3R2_9BACT|nr:DUF2141 domain-containing protein [Neolewinella maritima]CAH0998689.1 hypothetical protein LEM8419_00035 [Neolewinella maritima]
MYHLISLIALIGLASAAPQRISVEVVSSTAGGKVYVAAYASQAGFQNEDFIANASASLDAAADRTELALRVPERGRYVIAAFQDMNGNGELDRNFLGVPTEPYGFAKLPPSKWRSPSFTEVATDLDDSDHFRIEMRRWSEY